MFSLFFIRRPIFACVLSILIVLAGIVAYKSLPVALYPDITPPTVRVKAFYYGASAQAIADTVAAPIEQEVNGVDGMIYMNSTSAGDGSYQLDVTFKVGTNPDMASVLVQNRLSVAEPKLPEEVRRQGITCKKQSTNMVAVITLSAVTEEARKTYDDLYLANYITINVKDEILRTPGVGDLTAFPVKDYGMRIWLDPEKLRARDMTVEDAIAALREQNVQVAAGKIGAAPSPKGTDFTYQVSTQGRLESEQQFADIIVKSGANGAVTRVKDIGRVELGGKSYDTFGSFQNQPAAVVIVYQAPGGNAVQISEDLKVRLETMRKNLPAGIELAIRYDNAEFVLSSVHEVYKTLIEAVILVVIVVLVFLGSFRSTLIPIIVIPVALIGTFIAMAIFGFSVNTLTLFGLILAIGIVVDDAIVVVENVERNMIENHLAPKAATEKAMKEVFGAVIAISLVLMAVFVPTAALPGITGQMYKQFALTIAVSTALSAICALTLSPALCGIILKAHKPGHKPNFFNRGFNAFFNWLSNLYARFTSFLVHPATIAFSLIAFAGCIALIVWSMKQVPKGFLPAEDRGLVYIDVILPDNASMERTEAVMAQVNSIAYDVKGVEYVNTLGGMSLLYGNGINYAADFLVLKDWPERLPEGRTLDVILKELRQRLSKIQDAQIIVFTPPAIDGLGNAGGFDMRLQDRGSLGNDVMQAGVQETLTAARSQSQIGLVNSAYRAGVQQLFANIDREKVKQLKVPLQTVYSTLGNYLGSAYVNDFNKFGRTFQVSAQADARFRAQIKDIEKLEVRNADGKMIPLGTLLNVDRILGPDRVFRYNLYTSAIVTGEPALGVSTGQALEIMEAAATDKLPAGIGFEWTGMAYQEKAASGQGNLVFVLAILVVYLILAAQYESWTTPLAVVLSIPLAVLGAMGGLMLRGMDNNVYTQVGLVLLVGLGAKNAILIVEFARENRNHKGMDLIPATIEAAKQRLRPILMTSFAFILGVLPLVKSTGAGAASRQALGTAVFFGMIGSTILGLFFTPVLYVAIEGFSGLFKSKKKPEPEAETAATHAEPPAPTAH